MKWQFIRKYIDDSKTMKRCSSSLLIREIQIKITMEIQFLFIQLAKIPKLGNTSFWQDCAELSSLKIISRSAKYHKQYEENLVAFVKIIILYSLWPRNSTSGNLCICMQKWCTKLITEALVIRANDWIKPNVYQWKTG